MTDPSVLQFNFEDNQLRFPVAELEPELSLFTRHQLRKVQTILTLSSTDADTTKRLLATSPAADSDGTLWTGNLGVESYTDNGPHSLTITWTETEQLQADTIEFEGLSLQPTRYDERSNDDGSIAIAFQAALTKAETDRLRSLIPPKRSEVQYWPVVRRGVSDEPRSMRLGRVLWQRFGNDMIGHDITLVDDAHDSSEQRSAFLAFGGEPMVGNLVRQVSSLLAQYETLLTELEVSGVLGPEALERIRTSAESLGPDRRHAFFEVSDLSAW